MKGKMKSRNKEKRNVLSIISANVRGLQTNIGDLTHSFVMQHNPDIVATVETFLNDQVPKGYGRMAGYTDWFRKDRHVREKGGIAVCFKKSLHVQPLEVDTPAHMEISFFKIWITDVEALLFCTCYRPQWHGSEPLEFLQQNLDSLLIKHSCEHIVIVGDLNQHLVARSFEDLITTHGLANHVDFPTHDSGSSLDPVITDLPDSIVSCRPLGNVGSSDHRAVLTIIDIRPVCDEAFLRVTWLWKQGDWQGFREALERVPWDNILIGTIDEQVVIFTMKVLELQQQFIPQRVYKCRPTDQPWFGYRCRVAADKKSKAWNRYKRFPSNQNKQCHVSACKEMDQVQKWAIGRWKEDIKTKLSSKAIGSKEWWNLMVQQQGLDGDITIPPLIKPDGTAALKGKEKAELLATHFANKMTVPDPECQPPTLSLRTNARLTTCLTDEYEVRQYLKKINVNKALGPDNISPYILKKCASQLTGPLTYLFNACMENQVWPKLWKKARVVAIHKKNSKTCVENYRPISLLSILGKIYEKILAKRITNHLDNNHLLSLKQFGFRKNRSTADLLLQMTTLWNKALDKGEFTFVIALDIAGAFDRVWHNGLLAKLKCLGIDGELLDLMASYLQDRNFKVVVGGYESTEHTIQASVPQGSVLGPLLWNIFFDDILHLISEAQAYADDCTMHFTCNHNELKSTIHKINGTLRLISSFCKRWQVTLAQGKTQLMIITRRLFPPDLPRIILDGKAIDYKSSIIILGVQFDSKLTFIDHVKDLASRSAKKLACLRRVARFLDYRGCTIVYNSQIRSLMEYSPLVWSSCPPSYLGLLDRVQERVKKIANSRSADNRDTSSFQTLKHCRNVSGLCVLYKIQILRSPHLAAIRLPRLQSNPYSTRNSSNTGYEVEIPFAKTEQYLRSFHPSSAKLWNYVLLHLETRATRSLKYFKNAVHNLLNRGDDNFYI